MKNLLFLIWNFTSEEKLEPEKLKVDDKVEFALEYKAGAEQIISIRKAK